MNRKAFLCLVFMFVAVTTYSQKWFATIDFTASEYKELFSDKEDIIRQREVPKNLYIYPVPVIDYFDLAGDFEPIQIIIFDLKGEMVYRSHNIYERINLRNLQGGTYILQARNKKSEIKTIQFLKQ